MKKVSQIELKRLKKKGKVRRKMGAQSGKETPKPVVADVEEVSGSKATKRPASDLSSKDFYTVMGKLTDVLDRLETRTRPEQPSEDFSNVSVLIEPERLEPVLPDEPVESLLSQAAELSTASEPEPILRKPVTWTHQANRDSQTGLMSEIISTGDDGSVWTHTVSRSKKLIEKVVSESNTGIKLLHQFHRDRQQLIDRMNTSLIEANM